MLQRGVFDELCKVSLSSVIDLPRATQDYSFLLFRYPLRPAGGPRCKALAAGAAQVQCHHVCGSTGQRQDYQLYKVGLLLPTQGLEDLPRLRRHVPCWCF